MRELHVWGGVEALVNHSATHPLGHPDDPDPLDAVLESAASRIGREARLADREHACPSLFQSPDHVLGEFQTCLTGRGEIDGAQLDRAGEEQNLALG